MKIQLGNHGNSERFVSKGNAALSSEGNRGVEGVPRGRKKCMTSFVILWRNPLACPDASEFVTLWNEP